MESASPGRAAAVLIAPWWKGSFPLLRSVIASQDHLKDAGTDSCNQGGREERVGGPDFMGQAEIPEHDG